MNTLGTILIAVVALAIGVAVGYYVFRMLAERQQMQEMEFQQGFQQAQAEKDAWVSEKQPEFLPWVKNRMATLLETAARDNEELGFDEGHRERANASWVEALKIREGLHHSEEANALRDRIRGGRPPRR